MFNLSYVSLLWLLFVMQLDLKVDSNFDFHLSGVRSSDDIMSAPYIHLRDLQKCLFCTFHVFISHWLIEWPDEFVHQTEVWTGLSISVRFLVFYGPDWPAEISGCEVAYAFCQCTPGKLINQLWWARRSPSPHNCRQEGICEWWWGSFYLCWRRQTNRQ